MQRPRLRAVEKYEPPYPLNHFSTDFALQLGREITYLLATRDTPRLEGSDWESIFARLIGAEWKPSNIGLDDVVLEQTAWGAKTVKQAHPFNTKRIRLISGRNSPIYSFGEKQVTDVDPQDIGTKVLSIWNERVSSLRRYFRHLRTVVLIKSNDLLELAVFEFETVIYPEENYLWTWNERGNLEAIEKTSNKHTFTWQPHGSQFTIIEDVSPDRLAIRIRKPPQLDRDKVLSAIDFNSSWVEIVP
ncbi:MAG: hypothetical protein AB7H80_05780 [Candidatus Kapaibacterium sp.]